VKVKGPSLLLLVEKPWGTVKSFGDLACQHRDWMDFSYSPITQKITLKRRLISSLGD